MAIAEDVSTPTPTHQAAGTTGLCTSASFSPPANSLVVVNVVWMFGGTSPAPSSLSVKDSLNNVYTRGAELDNVQETNTGIYEFYYSSAPGSITVTVTCTNTAQAAVLLAPRVLTGANSNQSGAASATDNDDGNLPVVTTASGSWVYVVAGAPKDTRAPVADVTLTQIDFYDDSAVTKNQSAVGRLTTPTAIPGKVQTGWNANMAQASALEILPAAPILLGNGGNSGPQWQTGQVLASADVNTWILPLGQQVATANPQVSTTVLRPDPDLQLPFITAGNWAFRMVVFFDGPGTVDLKWGFQVPAGALVQYLAAYLNASDTLVLEAHTAADTPIADNLAAGNIQGLLIEGLILIGATPGSVSFEWAPTSNSTSAVNVDPSSYFMAWRLG